MISDYHLFLVTASITASIICSYIALDFAGRPPWNQGTLRFIWLWIGSGVMGLGIWMTHFIGMMPYHVSISVSYHEGMQFMSLCIAMFSSFLFLRLNTVTPCNPVQHIMSGIIMGIGIGSMHLVGMNAIILEPNFHYNGL